MGALMGKRLETGPTEMPDDWRGVFIRGDHCMHWARYLRQILEKDGGADVFCRGAVESLARTLEAASEFRSDVHPDEVQKIDWARVND